MVKIANNILDANPVEIKLAQQIDKSCSRYHKALHMGPMNSNATVCYSRIRASTSDIVSCIIHFL